MPASHRPLRTRASRPSTCPAGRNQHGSSSEGLGLRFASILSWVAILIGGYLLIGDFVRPAPPATAAPNTHRAAMRQPTESAPRSLAIDEVSLGRRLAGRNPLRAQVEEGIAEPDPATWREIHLSMAKEDGSRLYIELLRPMEWMELVGADIGATIYLDLAELGAEGEASVVDILPCPPIAAGVGTIVTGRFIHEVESASVVNLIIEGQSEPTGVTSNHPYWSVDRHDFIPAEDLLVGEQVDTIYGIRRIASIAPRPGPPVTKVYNLETLEHVYRVGELGTLVHNVCPWPKHHPFPKYLGGVPEQTLKKIPPNLHYRLHSALDKFMDGKYARRHTAAHFEGIDKATVVKDLTKFYKTAEGGIFKKYLNDFLRAVKESGY
jgi:hypothetical protein